MAGDMNVIRTFQSEWSLRKLLGPSGFQFLFSKMKFCKRTTRIWSQIVAGTASPCLTQPAVSSPQGNCPGKGSGLAPSRFWVCLRDPLPSGEPPRRCYSVCSAPACLSLKALSFGVCPCPVSPRRHLSTLLAKLGLSPWPVPGQVTVSWPLICLLCERG